MHYVRFGVLVGLISTVSACATPQRAGQVDPRTGHVVDWSTAETMHDMDQMEILRNHAAGSRNCGPLPTKYQTTDGYSTIEKKANGYTEYTSVDRLRYGCSL
jgi:hypothetical protein